MSNRNDSLTNPLAFLLTLAVSSAIVYVFGWGAGTFVLCALILNQIMGRLPR